MFQPFHPIFNRTVYVLYKIAEKLICIRRLTTIYPLSRLLITKSIQSRRFVSENVVKSPAAHASSERPSKEGAQKASTSDSQLINIVGVNQGENSQRKTPYRMDAENQQRHNERQHVSETDRQPDPRTIMIQGNNAFICFFTMVSFWRER